MLLVWTGALLCYATQALAGLLVWRALDRQDPDRCTRLSAALLVGPCAVTVQMLAYHALSVPFRVLYLVLPWWLLAAWIVVWRARRAGPTSGKAPGKAPSPTLLLLVSVLFLAIAARAFSIPIHDGDEVNNFALFARVFGSLGNLAPERLLHLAEPGHVEYPHLVALNQAWLFALDADSAPLTARGFEVLGALAFLLLCAGTSVRRGAAATAACVVCIATPAVLHTAVGFADVRLLATFMLLGREAQRLGPGSDARAPLRFAVVLGTAALTKNEGFAIAGLAALVLLYSVLRQRAGWRGVAALLLAGALLLLWPAVRHGIGLSMPYVDRALALPLAELCSQTPRVLGEWLRLMFPLDLAGLLQWGVFWWVTVPLVLLRLRHDRVARALALAWLLHLGLYTYMLAAARPGDLEALLGTAASRLLLHTMAWPALIVLRPAVGKPR